MRTVCKIPVPQVYTWNSRRNAVGAEYILMEKVPGVTLDTVWAKMHISDQFEVIKRIARYQETWMSTSFNQYGSVYFAQDLEGTGIAPLTYRRGQMTVSDKRYAIGPSVGREYFDAGRSTVQFDRGPCELPAPFTLLSVSCLFCAGPTLEAYLAGIGHREISCVKNVARLPRSPISLYGPGIYQPTRERKIKAIESYLAMIRYIAPANQSIASPCLWHGDLHVENIFVNPEAPTEIVGIIDWQSTQVAPLFYQARQPYFLDHEGVQVSGLERPQLPENFETLDNDAKKEANSLYFKQCLSALYRKFVYKYIPRLYSALEYQATPSFDLLLLARNLFIDGEATYLARVVELESTWSTLPGVIASKNGDKHYPFCFSDAEKADIEKSVNESLLGMQVMQSIQDTLGDLFPEKGIVKTEQYDEAKNALGQIKEQIIEQYAKNDHEKKVWEKEWPFDD